MTYNYWLQRRIASISYTVEITQSDNAKILVEEFYLDKLSFNNTFQQLIAKCNYDGNLEKFIKAMIAPNLISNHTATFRIYKSDNLKECWIMPAVRYLNCHRPWMSQKMFFSITCSIINTINSKFIK